MPRRCDCGRTGSSSVSCRIAKVTPSPASAFLPSGHRPTATDDRGDSCSKACFPREPICWSRRRAFGSREGRPCRPGNRRNRSSSSCAQANNPTASSRPCLPRFRLKSRVHWPGACSSHTSNLHSRTGTKAQWECLRRLAQVDPQARLHCCRPCISGIPVATITSNAGSPIELVLSDPVEAESIVAALETREDQVYGYERMAAALPAAEISGSVRS